MSTTKTTYEQAIKDVDKWVNIQSEDNDTSIINIDGEIGEDWWGENENTTKAIKAKLKAIANLDAKKIIVNINSLGGSVNHGLGIHDALASHPATIETNVVGMTASAATIIAQAGDVRKMSDNALYLIHQPWSMFISNVSELEQELKDLTTVNDRLVKIYTKRSGMKESKVRDLMDEANGNGKWIDADEAKTMGLIDEVYEPMKAAAGIKKQLENLASGPEAFLNKLPEIPESKINEHSKNNKMKDDKKTTNKLFQTFVDGIKAAFPSKDGKSTIPEELQTQLTELQGSIDGAAEYEGKLTALTTERDDLKMKFDESVASIAELTAKLEGKSTKIEGAKGAEDDTNKEIKGFGDMSEALAEMRGETKSTK